MPDDLLSLPDGDDFWPPALEARRCPDEAFAHAYEAMPDDFRGALKTAIALFFFHFGESGGSERRERADSCAGFAESAASEAVPWALCVFEAKNAAPAQLVAAGILPALCGVGRIAAFCAGGEPPPQALLALELCGVEDLFCADAKTLSGALQALPPGGRATLFGDSADFREAVASPGALWRVFSRRPALFAPEPRDYNLDVISLAFSQSREEILAPKNEPPDCLFAHENAWGARLALGPGLEAFWLPENFGPEFFRSSRCAFKFTAASSHGSGQ